MLRFYEVADETSKATVSLPGPERQQLSLPLPGLIERPPHGMSIPKRNRVYANRNLRMGKIDWIGFDMDYTLAIYRQQAMDDLQVRLTVERLVQRGYPESLKSLNFDPNFPIRGLLIDKKLGNILKMDRHKVVNQGFHGMQPIDPGELHKLYGEEKIRPESKRFHWIDTLFALSEVTSYAAVVSALEEMGETFDPNQLFLDVRAAIDFAHADGTVYRNVTANLPKYIERDGELPHTLHKLRSAGKHLFVLTNSPYHYTNTVMSYLLGEGEERYGHWSQYFDAVVCSSKKPSWFEPGATTPFLERTPDLEDIAPAKKTATGPLERGAVYEGGCLKVFEQLLGITGPNVLYVGDHIYGDILRSKKDSTWRTGLVVQELDQELAALEDSDDLRIRRRQLAEARPLYEDELRYYGAKFKEVARGKPNGTSADEQRLQKARAQEHIDRIRTDLLKLENEYQELDTRINHIFHPYWGSLLKEMNGLSIFGQQVDQYADIYMRRVSCLGTYSPTQFFRSPHDLMPHEI